MSSMICYRTDPWQHGIYLFCTIIRKEKRSIPMLYSGKIKKEKKKKKERKKERKEERKIKKRKTVENNSDYEDWRLELV